MKKRILSMILVFALLLGLCPVVTAQEEAAKDVILATYGSGLTVDGELSERQWLTYGKLTDNGATRSFGVLWDSDHLYLAAVPENGDQTLTVTVGKTLTVDLSDMSQSGELAGSAMVQKWKAVEIKLPFAALGISPSHYNQLLEASVAIDNMVWTGDLCISSVERSFTPTFGLTGAAGNTDNTSNTTDGASYTLSNRYQAGKTNINKDTRVYRIQQNVQLLTQTDMTAVLEFDFHVAAMPELEVTPTGHAYAARGFSGAMINANYEGACFGITNSADGLVFCLNADTDGQVFRSIALGRSVGDTFHMRLEYTPANLLHVYVDDTLLTTFINKGVDQRMGVGARSALFFDLWSGSENHPTADGKNDVEFTFSNVRLSNKVGDSVLDSLTFDNFRGDNISADAVGSDLLLPTVFSDGKLKNVELVWTSSDESVITNAGKVLSAPEAKTVTLTAALKADPTQSKSFDLTVLKMAVEAYLPVSDISVDGSMSELSWVMAVRQPLSVTDGASGSVSALWSKGKLWLGLTYQNADTVTLLLGEKTWQIPLAANISSGAVTGVARNGVAELQVDLAAAGITLRDYGHTVDYQVSLTGSGTASLQPQPTSLSFTGKQVQVRNLGENFVSNSSYANGVLTMTSTGGPTYWAQRNVPGLDHANDLYQEMTVTIDAMPEGSGALVGNLEARGFYFWIADLIGYEGNSSADNMTLANVYNAGGGALRIRVKTAVGYTDLEIGKQVGETFRLGYLWSAKDTVTVYVDGTNIGTVTNATYYATGGGEDLLTFRVYSPVNGQTATARIHNMTFTTVAYTTVDEELSQEKLLQGVNLSVLHDGDGITLPGVWETSLGTVNLDWTSDSDAIVLQREADGTVYGAVRGSETEYKTVTLTVSLAGRTLWSVQVTVDPNSLTELPSPDMVLASFTADKITLDGSAVGETWIMGTKLLSESGRLKGEFGVQWDAENLYLILDDRGGENTSVVINNVDVVAQAEAVSSRSTTEYKIPLSKLGITADRYNITVPVSVSVDGYTYEGTLILVSTDWWATGNRQEAMPIMPGYNKTVKLFDTYPHQPTEYQGTQATPNGWRLFDLYDSEGINPMGIRSYVLFYKMPIYDNMDDAGTTLHAEFDFQADALPVYDLEQARNLNTRMYSNNGISFSLARKEDALKNADTVLFGIYNSEEGLIFVAAGGALVTVPLNKQVGDLFRVGVSWEPDGDVLLYIDGQLFYTFPHLQFVGNAIGNGSFVMNLVRDNTAAGSEADNMDVTISNIGLGKRYDCSAVSRLSFDDIRGENLKADGITFDLTLPEMIPGQLAIFDETVTWSSSDPGTIDPETGKVTRPTVGMTQVVLTATLSDGSEKDFVLLVRGMSIDNEGVLVLQNDLDPANGTGEPTDAALFTLDADTSSVIRDQGVSGQVNVVRLRDLDSFSRINKESLTLWVSEDNVRYTEVEDFKLLHNGRDWYLYDFNAQGRYVKVHYTHFDGTDADFIGVPGEMITAYAEEVFGQGETAFETATVTVTNNTGADRKDAPWELTVAGDASVRVLLGGKYLYHYLDGSKVIVRIPYLAAGETVELTVLCGASDALDISNKEAVYEITYGTLETYQNHTGRWLQTIPAGTVLANGETAEREYLLAMSWPNSYISYDGGVTWAEVYPLDAAVSAEIYGGSSGGFIFDDQAGRIFFHSHGQISYGTMETARSIKKILVSEDGGKTWALQYTMEPDTVEGVTYNYTLSYSNGIVLSTYDGDGPNVDMAFAAATQFNDHTSFCSRVAYTRDGGATWEYSKTLMVFGDANAFEGGVSESTLLERDDGVLVCYSRCQFDYSMNFAMYYSGDGGVTWYSPDDPDPADHLVVGKVSSVYTGNTQPVLYRYDDAPMMFWGGNSVFGGDSNMRNPMSIAVSYDGMETFRNIQNLHSKTFLDEYRYVTSVTNPSVQKVGEDDLILVYRRLSTYEDDITIRVSDFSQWFYGTKGIYDSFEHGTVRYEGWVSHKQAAAGEITDKYSTDGDYAMRLDTGIGFRSVPYVQNGVLSMDVYLTEADAFTLQLQPALDVSTEKLPLITLTVENLTLIVGDTTLSLESGWNTITVNLALTEAQAAVSVNGGEFAELAPDTQQYGDYVTYLLIKTNGTIYVDNVLLVDDQDAVIYEQTEEGAVMQKIAAIGTVTLNSAERIAAAREAYEALTDEQKPLVTNYADLVAAEAALKALQDALPKISGNLSLNETIDINFIIPAEVDMTDAVLVVKNAATGEDVEYTILPGIGGTTVVRFSAKANHMTDEITVQVFDADGNALTQMASMSVRKYAGIRLTVAEETEKMMLIRMLDYGALAQINSGVTTDLANSIVTDDLRSFANAYDWADAVALEVPAGSGGVFKAGLALNETIDVTVYTDSSNVASGDKFVVKCNGEELATDQYIVRLLDDGRYVIRYSVKSNEMSDEIYIAIVGEDNTVKAETTLGVRIYAQKFLAAVPTGNQAAMLLAMLDYGALAQIYAGNTENLANCFVTDTLRQALISYPWP